MINVIYNYIKETCLLNISDVLINYVSSWFITAAAAALSKEREKIESGWKLHI